MWGEVATVPERQPRSDGLRIGRPAGPDEPQPVDLSELSRYDVLLAVIPLGLLLAGVVGQLTDVPVWLTLAVGALTTLPLLADGLAVNPPQ